MGKNELETILTSNDVMNIKIGIGRWFGSIEREYYMGVNAVFGNWWRNIPHATPDYGPGKIILRFSITDKLIVIRKKLAQIRNKL